MVPSFGYHPCNSYTHYHLGTIKTRGHFTIKSTAFQRNPVFDHQNTPDLDRRIYQLALDIENLNAKDLSSLWSILSGKYLPSILYKVRMLSFAADDIKAQIPVSKAPQPSVVH